MTRLTDPGFLSVSRRPVTWFLVRRRGQLFFGGLACGCFASPESIQEALASALSLLSCDGLVLLPGTPALHRRSVLRGQGHPNRMDLVT
jgi:hypothetical protein